MAVTVSLLISHSLHLRMPKTCYERRILNGQVNGDTLAVASRREQVARNYLFLRDIASGMLRSGLWQQAQSTDEQFCCHRSRCGAFLK